MDLPTTWSGVVFFIKASIIYNSYTLQQFFILFIDEEMTVRSNLIMSYFIWISYIKYCWDDSNRDRNCHNQKKK